VFIFECGVLNNVRVLIRLGETAKVKLADGLLKMIVYLINQTTDNETINLDEVSHSADMPC
jgi:hypothetical protein